MAGIRQRSLLAVFRLEALDGDESGHAADPLLHPVVHRLVVVTRRGGEPGPKQDHDHLLLLPQLHRRLELAAVAGDAVDGRFVGALEGLDLGQEIGVDLRHHLDHAPGDLLFLLVVGLPLAGDVAVGAGHSQAAAVDLLHLKDELLGGVALHHLDGHEDLGGGLLLAASHLLA